VVKLERTRYLSICIHGDVDPHKAWRELREALRRLLGEFGLSQAGLLLIEVLPGKLILKCSHKSVWMVRAAAAAVKEAEGSSCLLHVERVSGTLKKLRKALKESKPFSRGDEEAMPQAVESNQ